ncbi:MAG: isoprenylcysteine carboxylmethyltransferase family protein [bacterium]|nr:isoprenylcysteine carboxylmethyltransferase family protein [bacterium]
MDTARYSIALFLIMLTPGVFVYWISIHPFVSFWRRQGARATIILHCLMMAALGVVAFLLRKPILATDYGTNYWLIAAAVPIYVFSVILRRRLFGHLTIRTLAGVPELSAGDAKGELLTEGVYAKARHPRYAQIFLAFVALALIANHLATYIIAVAAVPWIYLVVYFEERELRNRFGEAYDDYRARVPRFLPRRQAIGNPRGSPGRR